MEIASQRDFHAATTSDGSSVEVTSLHSTTSVPVYSPVADLGKRVRLLVERLPVPIWITGPANGNASKGHQGYTLFADAISYWIWQFAPFLAPLLASVASDKPLEIRISLPSEGSWETLLQQVNNYAKSPVETTSDALHRFIEVTVNPEFIPLLRTANNAGERELMRSILLAFLPFVEEPKKKLLTLQTVEAALNKIAPVGMKKMMLLFDSGRTPEIDATGLPHYRPLQKVWINEHLDRVGEYLDTNGLPLGAIDVGRRTAILNDVAAHCFSQVERIVAALSPEELLEFIVVHSESVHREQSFNRLTIPTRLECFHSVPGMIEDLGKRIPELAHVGLASRLLAEYVVAQAPEGLRPISLDVYDELRSWSHHCVNYAMLSDAVQCGIEEYKLSLLPSKRLGIDGTAWQRAMESHIRAFALDQIGAAPEHFKRQWGPSGVTVEGDSFRAELDSATSHEFGLPLSLLLELMEFAISHSREHAPGVTVLPREIFIKEAKEKTKRTEDRLGTMLDFLSLGPRQTFWIAPDGYVKQDLYPWRYNRALSYMRRPFLNRTHNGSTEIVWGMRHVRAAQRFLVDQCTSGKLKAKTGQMRSFMNGLRDAQGEVFNKQVFAFFNALGGLSVKSRVKKVGSLRDLNDHLGDVDVLVGDPIRHRVLVAECKDMSAARTPYEMANEIRELFVGSAAKKSIVDKHRARTDWVKSHLGDVLAYLNLARDKRWKVLPLIVVDQPLAAAYIRESPIQVVSFEELKRFWPDLRRV
jgi:hypothetical protein